MHELPEDFWRAYQRNDIPAPDGIAGPWRHATPRYALGWRLTKKELAEYYDFQRSRFTPDSVILSTILPAWINKGYDRKFL
jgi:hypothetical protein